MVLPAYLRGASWFWGTQKPDAWDAMIFPLGCCVSGASGWFVIRYMGRPGMSGFLRDIGLALVALVAATLCFSLMISGPMGLFGPLLFFRLTLEDPIARTFLLIGGAVLLAYARLTTASPVTPATTPPA